LPSIITGNGTVTLSTDVSGNLSETKFYGTTYAYNVASISFSSTPTTVSFNTGTEQGSFKVSVDAFNSDDDITLCNDNSSGGVCNFNGYSYTPSANAQFDITNFTETAVTTPEPGVTILFVTMLGLVGFTTRKKFAR